jgi:hypothetical protein
MNRWIKGLPCPDLMIGLLQKRGLEMGRVEEISEDLRTLSDAGPRPIKVSIAIHKEAAAFQGGTQAGQGFADGSLFNLLLDSGKRKTAGENDDDIGIGLFDLSPGRF